nr:hypothetical protein [Tanacetum cinerariifolium]
MIFDGLVKNVNNKISKFLMYPRFLTTCLRMSQFSQITHTHTYVVPFHTRKLFTTLRVNSPSFSGRIVPLFDTILVHKGEGSGTPTEPHHTPSHEAQSPSHTTHTSPTLPPVTTTSLPTVTQSNTPIVRQYTRRTRIAQSSILPTVADEPASPLRDVNQGEACPTDSSFIADQDRATIDKSSTFPHDSAPRVTSPVADEGTQEVEINRLKERVKILEDREGVVATRSGDDAPIKGRSMDKGEAATERISDDSEEIATVLTSMDAATILASGVVDVFTGSGSIPTASTPAKEQVPTGSDVVPTIDAQVARELEEQLEREDQRRSEQITRDAEIARINAKEELQIMIDGLDKNNETIAKYLQEYHQFASELPIERRIELITDLVKYQDNYAKIYKYQSQQRKPMTKKQKRDYYMVVIRNNLGWKVKDFRGMTFKEVEAKFNLVWKQMEDFIPMGSKEEAERIKRKGLNLEQESVKKQKTSEEVPEEVMSHEEVLEEKVELRRLYESDHEDQLWTHTQNFMHALIEWNLYDTCGAHHVTSKDKEIFMLVEKDYPLMKGLALVMISYKLQVENYSKMANNLILKIYKIANSLRQEGLWYLKDSCIALTAFVDADHAGCQDTRKSTSGSMQLLGDRLAFEASMERENMDEFLAKKDMSRKRRYDNQDPPPPLPDSDLNKKKRHDSDSSGLKQPPAPYYSLTSAAAQSSSAVASLCISSGNLSSLAVGSCSGSGKSSLAVGMPCAFYSQQSSPKLDAPAAIKFLE